MKISRWGNSLGVRLPASVVEALGLAEGDEIEIDVVGARAFEVPGSTARSFFGTRASRTTARSPGTWRTSFAGKRRPPPAFTCAMRA